ncbi:hypothetical protein N8I77_006225 [Diaporthe amygdali]|uniref:Uncharacterized protein n=1 Tax=Phomopsis amygdali TaxID=1214568 RepID=A0AAD9SG89_PHOAM|nr:hypothetical protein N8I77_006225 [Diaporthe amygdali]
MDDEHDQTQREKGEGIPPVRDDVVDEKARASLHSDEKPSRLGRHSLDVGRKPDLPSKTKDERSHSLPALNDDTRQPQSPPPTHAPTNANSSRQRAVRASAEFDRRFDGPYARPSISIARRKSSQQARLDAEHVVEAVEGREPASDASATSGPAPQLLEPRPPPLNYTLHTRYWAIFIFWFFIIFDSVVMPIALYYGLWYGVGPGSVEPGKKSTMSANTVYTVVTAAIGGASILEYFVRFWRLWKKDSVCRVIGAHRWYLDAFHWNYTLAWLIIMVELIVGTVQDWPPIRLVAMPLTTMLYTFGTEMLIVDILRVFRVPAPFRLSSIPKGAQLRPCVYTLIEDICAVDGSGGTDFREALNRRYEASHIFRTMLRRLGVFWAVGAQAMAVVCTILIFTVSEDAAYAIGWSVPFGWAGVWAVATIWYVKKELKREKAHWIAEASKSTA